MEGGSVPATVLNLESITKLDDEAQFIRLSKANPHLRLERDRNGALVIMPPSGFEGSRREVGPLVALDEWNERTRLGVVLGPTVMFKLPIGPWRCPDAAWVSRSTAAGLSAEERRGFPPVAPDFVIEVRSPSDTRRELEARMEEWMEAGGRLAWLLDPDEGTATVYQSGGSHEVLRSRAISGAIRCFLNSSSAGGSSATDGISHARASRSRSCVESWDTWTGRARRLRHSASGSSACSTRWPAAVPIPRGPRCGDPSRPG